MDSPSPFELWQQAGGDRDAYRALLREHGHLIPREPGDDSPLFECGWKPAQHRATRPMLCGCGHAWMAHDINEHDGDGSDLCCVEGCDQNGCPGKSTPPSVSVHTHHTQEDE